MHIPLNVPFQDKDFVKKIGAQWDNSRKIWYLWDYKKIQDVKQWLTEDYNIYITENLYLVEGQRICWGCKKSTPVFSVGADKFSFYSKDERMWKFSPKFYLFNGISKHCNQLNSLARSISQNHFWVSKSKTIQTSYLMNHCYYCNRHQGENYLYDEMDAVFAPDNYINASTLTLHKIKIDVDIGLKGNLFSCFSSCGDTNMLIFNNAKVNSSLLF